MKKVFAILSSLILMLATTLTSNAAEHELPVVSTTLPCLTSMTNFIVGGTMLVHPLTQWTENGTTKRTRGTAPASPIIALDPKDALSTGIATGSPSLHLLYGNFPVRDIGRNMLIFDPSVLPFLSQRLLIVLSELQPESYPFYQRRLAEFQSRLESSLEVGRSLIGSMTFLDLTGAVGKWIKAAAPETVRPPDELWGAWLGSTRTDELRAALTEARKRGWRVITDSWTPAIIKKIAAQEHTAIININAPERADYDFFTYFHDIYLAILNAASGK